MAFPLAVTAQKPWNGKIPLPLVLSIQATLVRSELTPLLRAVQCAPSELVAMYPFSPLVTNVPAPQATLRSQFWPTFGGTSWNAHLAPSELAKITALSPTATTRLEETARSTSQSEVLSEETEKLMPSSE